MAKSYGRKPTTPAGKRLSVAHLKATDKLLAKKVKDHEQQANQGVDVAYNKSHLKAHKKDRKNLQKYLKKVAKLRLK